MRLISAVGTAFIVVLAWGFSGESPAIHAGQGGVSSDRSRLKEGQAIFRFDTFGDEQLWTDVLALHQAIPAVSPATALAVGLKVDAEALPPEVIAAIREGNVDLTDPAVTLELLRLNAVVGVKGVVSETGELQSIGVTCALCHSSVDDSIAPGIGRRLDGWANVDLNVGAIVSLSPTLDPGLKEEFSQWGPGMYDPRHHAFDGTGFIPLNSPSLPVVIPPIYGLRGVEFETFTGDGPISYWNSYVGVGQMGGKGDFSDPRIGLFIDQAEDLVTPKLRALLEYQLSLQAPRPRPSTLNVPAVQRGRQIFRNEAGCVSCHRPPHFTDVLSGPDRSTPLLHAPAEVGMDAAYADRSATKLYRTTPLRGLLQHPPYFHDGSAPDLPAVVDHYDGLFGLNLTPDQKADLVEYLKSL